MTSQLRPRHIPRQRRPLCQASWEILRDIDQVLAGDEVPPYTALRPRLDAIPNAERGIDWAERVVKVYCRKKMNAQRCNVLISRIGAKRHAMGEVDHHLAFQDELLALTAPHILTLHGYILPLRNRDQAAVVSEVKQLMDQLTDLGYASFINSGTLLGAVREGALLGHDDDVDLAVVIKGKTERELVDAFIELGSCLNRAGVLSKPAQFSKGIPVLKVELPSSVLLDLFPIWTQDDRVYIWPHSFGELSNDDVFPLTTREISGVALPAPRNPEKMLALNYGDGWQSPDVHFAFPWKAARRKFKRIIGRYKRSRQWAGLYSKVTALRIKTSNE